MSTMVEFWKQLIDIRKQTVAWNLDKEVLKSDIDDIIEEVHRRSPVKQNRVHYQISVVDFSDPEFRNDYYEFCVDRDNPDHRYNSQVLAQYMLVFTFRNPGDFSADFSKRSSVMDKMLSHLEIGLAADFIVHAAAARGLACGFCRCYDLNYKPDVIKNKLGIDDVADISLTVGIGYAAIDDKTLNPYTGEYVDAPYEEKWREEPKPPMADYIKYI